MTEMKDCKHCHMNFPKGTGIGEFCGYDCYEIHMEMYGDDLTELEEDYL